MIFKLRINDIELDTDGVEYFELVKGSVIGSDIGTINREYSTNITLPATQTNVSIFRAHKLWGGSSEIFKGVAHFGFEAFECLVQLVEFDDKKITIYLIKNNQKYERANRKWGDILKDFHSEYGKLTLLDLDNTDEAGALSTTYGIKTRGSQETLQTIMDRVGYSDLFAPLDGADFPEGIQILPLKPKGQLGVIYGKWEVNFTTINANTLPLTLRGETMSSQTGAVRFDDREGVSYLKLDKPNENLTFQNLDKIWFKFEWKLITGHADYVNVAIPFTDETVSCGIGATEKVADLSYDSWRKAGLVSIGGASGELRIRWNMRVLFLAELKPTINSEPLKYPFLIEHAPDLSLLDIYKSVLIEKGLFASIRQDGLIKHSKIPSIDDGDVFDASYFFNKLKKTTVNKKVMKAKNNYINYVMNDNEENANINIKIDEAPEDESTFFDLKIVYNGHEKFPKDGVNDALRISTPPQLGVYVERFRTFRDAYNNPIICQIEFKGMFEVPEKILYIEQLNGLFLPEKIIKTSKNVLILNCYKIEKQ